jgi:two-component system chemotaxis response regulator CheY
MTKKRFLIVDDDKRFTDLVARKLSKHGHCVIALAGDDAVLQFEHHLRKKQPFDAVFMDIEMPKMTGHEVVARMRTIEQLNDVSPINSFKLIMLTAHKDMKNISKSFFRDGADAFIPKENIGDMLEGELQKNHLV